MESVVRDLAPGLQRRPCNRSNWRELNNVSLQMPSPQSPRRLMQAVMLHAVNVSRASLTAYGLLLPLWMSSRVFLPELA